MRILLLLVTFLFSWIHTHALIPELEEIVKRGELVVAVYATDTVPFFAVSSEGELEGYDIDLAKKIANLLGVKVRFDRNYPTFNSLIKGIAEKQADLGISYLSRTVERAESVYFSNPYISIHFGLAINREELSKQIDKRKPFIEQINEKRLKIGVLGNSAMVQRGLSLFDADQLVYLPSNDAGFTAAKNKEVFAFLTDEIFMNGYILSNPNESLYLKNLLFKDLFDHMAIAIPPGQEHVKYWIDVMLDGEKKISVAELFERYQKLVLKKKADERHS